MIENKQPWIKIEQRLTAEPIHRAGWTVQPVAQLVGWQWAGRGPTGGFAGALMRIRPLELIVHQDGAERTIPMVDPVNNGVRAILLTALMVSSFCWVVMFVAQRFITRR
jgi:hypothetical protein